jgi:hypothetical protein
VQKCFVAAGEDVVFDPLRIDLAGILQHDLLLCGEEGQVGRKRQTLCGWTFHRIHDGGHVATIFTRLDVLVEQALGFDRHQWSGGTQPHATDTLYMAFSGEPALLNFLFQPSLYLVATL